MVVAVAVAKRQILPGEWILVNYAPADHTRMWPLQNVTWRMCKWETNLLRWYDHGIPADAVQRAEIQQRARNQSDYLDVCNASADHSGR